MISNRDKELISKALELLKLCETETLYVDLIETEGRYFDLEDIIEIIENVFED